MHIYIRLSIWATIYGYLRLGFKIQAIKVLKDAGYDLVVAGHHPCTHDDLGLKEAKLLVDSLNVQHAPMPQIVTRDKEQWARFVAYVRV